MAARMALLTLLMTCGIASPAMANLWHQGISQTGVDLDGDTVVLGQLTVDLPTAGRVLVHFDGYCVSSPGDRIVLAASDEPDWQTDDGNVSVEAYNATQDARPFSHTRSYDVAAGEHTFYAVGQNWVEKDGTGIASVYASLTVKFYPEAGPAFVEHLGIEQVGVDLRGAPVSLGSLQIAAPVAGRAVVRFDGGARTSPGDLVLLAANDDPDWEVSSGNVSVAAVSADLDTTSFAHTRVFDVAAGDHTFHAVGENFVDEDGTGIGSVYGSLTVEFHPTTPWAPVVVDADIEETRVDFRGADVVLAQIDFDAPSAGDVLLRFDGLGVPDSGDLLRFAANDQPQWEPNDGGVTLEVPILITPGPVPTEIPFSHSRAYAVEAGVRSFYAAGENWVRQNGSGLGSAYGRLTLQFFPVPEPTGRVRGMAALLALGFLGRVRLYSRI